MKPWCKHIMIEKVEDGELYILKESETHYGFPMIVYEDFLYCPICGKERPKENHKQGEK